MWGQGSPLGEHAPAAGIIPTRVGTSGYSYNNSRLNKDHPHACGDKSCTKFLTSILVGSSPRVWGQGVSFKLSVRVDGIIPTRVGTRQQVHNQSLRRRDHPHACGDKVYTIFYKTCFVRIIPTRVGTSLQNLVNFQK